MNHLFEYLKEELDNKDKELFLVVTSEVEKNQDWLSDHGNLNKNNMYERDAEVVQVKDIAAANACLKVATTPNEEYY